MSLTNAVRIEPLNKNNYDTWKIQMQAVLVKNDMWGYVIGKTVKPEPVAGNAGAAIAVEKWEREDEKAKADLILAISPSELKQIKCCDTSKDIWEKLKSIFQSKGPARKATLLKRLTLHRMENGDDVSEHLCKFFDTLDKLNDMEIEINKDLLTIMLLYSLSPDFENFRVAIESRDDLPSPEDLRIKIIEEAEARKNDTRGIHPEMNAMMVKKNFKFRGNFKKKNERYTPETEETFRFRCHRCGKIGHKAAECEQRDKNRNRPGKSFKNSSLYLSSTSSGTNAACQGKEAVSNNKWCLDSGCSSHFCKNLSDFVEIDKSAQGHLDLANSATTKVTGRGTVAIQANVNGQVSNLYLNNTMHVPDLRNNLLSVSKITEKGYRVIFEGKTAVVVDREGDTCFIADQIDNLYYIRMYQNKCMPVVETDESPKVSGTDPAETWHRRMGHLNVEDLWECSRYERVNGIKMTEPKIPFECEICIQGKMTRRPFPKKSEKITEMLEIVHTDVCGPMRIESLGKSRYFVTFTDEHSRWSEIYFLKEKGDVLKAFKEYKSLAENLTGKRIKYLQSDNGKEFVNSSFDAYLRDHGIQRRLAITYSPQQNGIAERKNRTLVEMARCLLLQSGLTQIFWAEAVFTANHIRNRCPTSSLSGKTPHEIWKGKIPDVSYFQEFGSEVLTLNKKPNKGKFEPRGKKGIFLGYSDESKGYRVWLPQGRKVEIVRDIRFLNGPKRSMSEKCVDFTTDEADETTSKEIELVINQQTGVDESDCDEEEPDSPTESERRGPGRPKKIRTGLRGRPRNEYNIVRVNAEIVEENHAFMSEVPLKQAISAADADEWRHAMAAEVKSILKNDTWKMVQKPPNCEVIGSRMVLRNKFSPDGSIEKRKARIVAQGFSQRPGIHFNQTFAPVARMSSIRLLTAIAAHFGMDIQHLDVTTAYLNSTIEEEIYMSPPKMLREALETIIETERNQSDLKVKAEHMLERLKDENNVCLLKRSLYGLRQAGRNWYNKLDDILRKNRATPCDADPCMYYIGQGKDLVLIAIYVDDILLASRDTAAVNKIKSNLARELEIKDLGTVRHCLGIEFIRSGNKIAMHQKGYIRDVLKRFGMMESKPVGTPMDINVKLSNSEQVSDPEVQKLPYRELVGALMYLAVSTRPDIAFAVSALSQFNNSYGKAHWTAAKRVLRYLKGTMDQGIVFESDTDSLKGFVDADWGNCSYDRRSFTGYTFVLSRGPISWEARKQRTVALSSTEAEYMSLTEGAKEAIYLRSFLSELGLKKLADVVVFNDNLGAKRLAENPTLHARSKHIDLKHHFVREVLRNRQMKLEYLSTEEMPADMLTKGLPRPKHLKCCQSIGVSPVLCSF